MMDDAERRRLEAVAGLFAVLEDMSRMQDRAEARALGLIDQTPTQRDRLRKAEWLVAPTDHAEAVSFLTSIHYAQGAPNTSVYRHGLFRADAYPLAHLDGIAMWLPPSPTTARSVHAEHWRGVLMLTRLAVHPDTPPNAASFLLGRSMRLIDRTRWPHLVTYADTGQGHTGAIYRATNWRCLGEVPAGDVWVDAGGVQRGRKRGPRNMSAAEMRAAGFERKASAPKIKFVHP